MSRRLRSIAEQDRYLAARYEGAAAVVNRYVDVLQKEHGDAVPFVDPIRQDLNGRELGRWTD